MTVDFPAEVAPIRPGEEQDWAALERYLRHHLDAGDALGELVGVRQFPDGWANLTYLVQFQTRRLVIRRPPFGRLAVGAHDMKREFRALSQLWRTFDRAPRAYLLCADTTVLGAEFLVIEYRPGVVIRGHLPASLAAHDRAAQRVGFAVVDALADLHRLDPVEAGVADLGRADGFVARQLSGWHRRWHATSHAAHEPAIDEVFDRLTAAVPPAQRASVLHNDFKIDNCQFDATDPDRVRSIFDWDMATLGDPLVDLGTMLSYWPDPPDAEIGLPTRAEVVERYAARSGLDVSTLSWYEAFGAWKIAVVLAQLHDRYLRGETTDERQASRGARVPILAQRARTILDSG